MTGLGKQIAQAIESPEASGITLKSHEHELAGNELA